MEYAAAVSSQAPAAQASTIYRLEPGFLIQGRMLSSARIKPNTDKRHACKVMERGEVGWAGGSAGPDFFIYLGTGPASWLGNPHEGAVFAEVADEASMAVAANISLVPVGPTPPGQMHLLKEPLRVAVTPWSVPDGALDVSVPRDGSGIVKVGGAAIDEGTARCGASCHALARTELHGGVVKWGEQNLKADASACCRDCAEHAADPKNAKRPCNVWVYCSSAERCGKRFQQCWLKNAADLWADTKLLVGTSDAWTSGTAEGAPESHPSGAGRRLPRAAAADVVLSLGPAEVRVRLRTAGAPRAAAAVAALAKRGGAGAAAAEHTARRPRRAARTRAARGAASWRRAARCLVRRRCRPPLVPPTSRMASKRESGGRGVWRSSEARLATPCTTRMRAAAAAAARVRRARRPSSRTPLPYCVAPSAGRSPVATARTSSSPSPTCRSSASASPCGARSRRRTCHSSMSSRRPSRAQTAAAAVWPSPRRSLCASTDDR